MWTLHEPKRAMAKGITQTDRFMLFWGGWPSQWHPASFIRRNGAAKTGLGSR